MAVECELREDTANILNHEGGEARVRVMMNRVLRDATACRSSVRSICEVTLGHELCARQDTYKYFRKSSHQHIASLERRRAAAARGCALAASIVAMLVSISFRSSASPSSIKNVSF